MNARPRLKMGHKTVLPDGPIRANFQVLLLQKEFAQKGVLHLSTVTCIRAKYSLITGGYSQKKHELAAVR